MSSKKTSLNFETVQSETDTNTPVFLENNDLSKDMDDEYSVPKKEQLNFLNFEDLILTANTRGNSEMGIKISSV